MVRVPDVIDSPRGRFEVARAWPRGGNHLLLELHDRRGRAVGGQWFSTTDDADRATRKLGEPAFRVGSAVVQPGGLDRRLPALAAEVARSDNQLVTHRPGKRAVLRRTVDGATVSFLKVVRTEKAQGLAQKGALAAERLDGIAEAPRLISDARLADGVLEWSVVPGRTLQDLGSDQSWTSGQAATAWTLAGAALRGLHASEPDGVEGWHGPADELAAIDSWLTPAVDFGLLDAPLVRAARGHVADILHDGSAPVVGVLHRDLHDKQILLDDGERIGLIDVDTLARGERALDIANVLAHLELREAQGLLQPRQRKAAQSAFFAASGAEELPTARIEAYLLATRLRLSGVYCFRPRWRKLAKRLLRAVVLQPIHG